ncbi:MAG: methyltransferase type 11 [Anaerolineaceae bacterium]|nr:methyltransferase type 11 [Anaerolineaceae bacterium]
MKKFLKSLISEPQTRGLDIDNPSTTLIRRDIIKRKGFLRRIYEEWYGMVIVDIPKVDGMVLELGSGGGFIENYDTNIITSEVFYCSHVHMILDGTKLPFSEHSLKSIVMIDVLHHIPDPNAFFKEALRCVNNGGTIVMIEPWVTTWSKFVYQNLHHEPFIPNAISWKNDSSGPLSGANGALPWIIFKRDANKFSEEFPKWKIEKIYPFMPFRYLLSGGVSLRSIVPEKSYDFWKALEQKSFRYMDKHLAMFSKIVLRKVDF